MLLYFQFFKLKLPPVGGIVEGPWVVLGVTTLPFEQIGIPLKVK